jgi:probable LLM family oxidoreductase
MGALALGLHSFGDVSGEGVSHAQVLRDVVAEGVLADEVGVDALGLGEHHRDDYAISAPEIVLAAIAARTTRLRLGTAVTVLSSDDPIRLHQRAATLHALADGRVEIIVGRGSFTESFPLFGFDLRDYERLFEEKLDLLVRLLREPAVTWSGTIRRPLDAQRVFPPVAGAPYALWIGVGGSPESVVRAARHDLPLMLAIIGGPADRFAPYADLYARTCAQLGRAPRPIGVHSPGHVAATDAQAREEYWPAWRAVHDRIGRERGWPPLTRAAYDREVDTGSLYVGSPETVARRIAATVRALGLARFDLKYAATGLSHARLMTNIELYGTRVIPLVRELVAGALPQAPPGSSLPGP